jgi:hypothetical protein
LNFVKGYLVRDEGVAGSNPATPTNKKPANTEFLRATPPRLSGHRDSYRDRNPGRSPLQAIRQKCLWCCNGSAHEVALCPAKACPSWAFRFGHKPSDELIAEQGETRLHPLEWRMTAAEFHARGHSALKAIKRKCFDCSGASKSEVRNCGVNDCALHAFRQGNNPNRTYSPEERARRSEHLAKLKNVRALAKKAVSIGDPRANCAETGASERSKKQVSTLVHYPSPRTVR